MQPIISDKIKEKFEMMSNLKLSDIREADSKCKLVTFDKFSINDELNAKLLTAQGVNSEYVKLQSKRKQTSGKLVYMFRVQDNVVKSFYTCYVEKTADKMPVVKQENVSVIPTNAENNRPDKHKSKLANLFTGEKKEVPTVQAQFVTKEEFESLNSKLDALIGMMKK